MMTYMSAGKYARIRAASLLHLTGAVLRFGQTTSVPVEYKAVSQESLLKHNFPMLAKAVGCCERDLRGSVPGIDGGRSNSLKVFRVPSNDSQTVDQRGRSNQ